MAVTTECTKIEVGSLLGVDRINKADKSVMLGIAAELCANKAKITDIDDQKDSRYYEWKDIFLIQNVLDKNKLTGYGVSDPPDPSDDNIYSLCFDETDNKYTSVYYPCQYISHDTENVQIKFYDNNTEYSLPFYIIQYNYKIPVVIKVTPSMNSHPFNELITSINAKSINKDLIDDLSQLQIGNKKTRKRLWNQVDAETIAFDFDENRTNNISDSVTPKEYYVASIGKWVRIYSMETCNYDNIEINISNDELFSKVCNCVVKTHQNGSISYQMKFKEPVRDSRSELCTLIEESPEFIAQYPYVALSITQGGIINDENKLESIYYCQHHPYSGCMGGYKVSATINITNAVSLFVVSATGNEHMHYKNIPVGFLRKHQRGKFGKQIATLEYTQVMKQHHNDIRRKHNNFTGSAYSIGQLRKNRSIVNQVIPTNEMRKITQEVGKMTDLQRLNIQMPILIRKYKMIDLENNDNMRGLNYNDIGYIFKWCGSTPALILTHEAHLNVVRQLMKRGAVVFRFDDASNLMELIDGHRLNHSICSITRHELKALLIFMLINGDWRSPAFRNQLDYVWNRLTGGDKNCSCGFSIDGYTGLFKEITDVCNGYDPVEYSRRCMLYGSGQVSDDRLPNVLIRRGKEHQFKNIARKFKKYPICHRFAKACLHFQITIYPYKEWRFGMSIMIYLTDDKWKPLDCNDMLFFDPLKTATFDVDKFVEIVNKEKKIWEKRKEEKNDGDDTEDMRIDQPIHIITEHNLSRVRIGPFEFIYDFDDNTLTILSKRLNVTLPIVFRKMFSEYKVLFERKNIGLYLWEIHHQWYGNNSPVIFDKFEENVSHNNDAENSIFQLRLLMKRHFVNCKPTMIKFIDTLYKYMADETLTFVQHHKLITLQKNKKTISHIAGYKPGGSFKRLHEKEKLISNEINHVISSLMSVISPFPLTDNLIYVSLKSLAISNEVTIFECQKSTALGHIRKMKGNRHWSYDPDQLDLVLLWLELSKKLLNKRKTLLNCMDENDQQSMLLVNDINNKIVRFVKGKYESMNELIETDTQ
eukprot:308544_1